MAAPAPPISRVGVEAFIGNGKPRKRATEKYAPAVIGGDWMEAYIDGRPLFTLQAADRMRRDPKVEFALRILRAPLYRVPFQVQADNPRVGRYVQETINTFWSAHLRQICNSMFTYGPAVGELTDRLSNGLVVVDRFDDVHPRDARPLEYKTGPLAGQWAGVRVRGATASGFTGGMFDLSPPHCFWLPGENEYGRWWGRPRIAGAYEPWLEKRGKGGAVESRRLCAKKCAFRGGSIRHPMGQTEYATGDGDTVLIDNEDLAREIVEKYENGGVLTLPNARDEKGEYLWEFDPPGASPLPDSIFQYPKDLDDEILTGIGIPPEVVEMAEGGGGWSGRAIPAMAFFASEDEIVNLAVDAINVQVIRPRVAVNFGPAHVRRYRIKPGSLAEMVNKDASQAGKMTEEPDSRQAVGGGHTGAQGTFDGRTKGGNDRFRLPDNSVTYRPHGVQLSHEAGERLLAGLDRLADSLAMSFDESKVNRDHGQFSTKPGAKAPRSRKKLTVSQATAALAQTGHKLGAGHFDTATKKTLYAVTFPDGKVGHLTAEKIKELVYSPPEKADGETAPAPSPAAEERIRTLAQRIADVPAAVREKVAGFVRSRYDKLAARYGDAGAKSILAASVMLLPVPVPGTSFLPIALAEAILQIRRATRGPDRG